jgi:hypothetical protein
MGDRVEIPSIDAPEAGGVSNHRPEVELCGEEDQEPPSGNEPETSASDDDWINEELEPWEDEEVTEEEDVAVTVEYMNHVLESKTTRCTSRCSKGCKRCACARKGEPCDSKCGCTNCMNNGQQKGKAPEFAAWTSTNPYDQKETTFDPKQSGSKNIPVNKRLTEADAFSLFLDEEVLDHFVKETQVYAVKKGVTIIITPDIIKRYFITIFATGLAPLPAVELYWTSRSRLRRLYSNTFVQQSLSRTEFWKISQVIHYKLDWLEEHLNKKYKRFWKPFQYLTVDEGMIAFKGRFGGRQHVRGKPHATGIKFWALCDETGYMYILISPKGDRLYNTLSFFSLKMNFCTAQLE